MLKALKKSSSITAKSLIKQQPNNIKKPMRITQPKVKPVIPSATKNQNANGGTTLTDLQERMKKNLAGGRFRMINELLYTTPSALAVSHFEKEPETFKIVRRNFLLRTYFPKLFFC
jgi:accessory colonization factor AcfC